MSQSLFHVATDKKENKKKKKISRLTRSGSIRERFACIQDVLFIIPTKNVRVVLFCFFLFYPLSQLNGNLDISADFFCCRVLMIDVEAKAIIVYVLYM